ncbi:catechol 1,2-dioxygenase [Ignatzschineria cameli]|uniref:catechol 1,2-dioxygenase n=1 Tax=Ignatzschineria cameli TaxID=2182793 RepID=A0A2U2AQQ0_9GAMM|nr:catechol 1,2-dioxygenase [Ignatzschineria cameli]PWD85876.1 catechol 1,2-dioxygenase [Ignatzschineria cameli]PWD89504.1 catechol 1,2-dioxygenase [Ignatzschineria cameli]PWD90976.1 catechol 1,2-dioxygenase [Ignatzschineria cameli]PWD91764.1 catechol 1,2-dioxygenase [Ignatzschineria cameli]
MKTKISSPEFLEGFLRTAAGYDSDEGNPRVKEIVHRLLSDLCKAIDDLDITVDEFWHGANYLLRLGQAHETALLVAGLGLEHILDVREDELDEKAGLAKDGATPRTIEGPLYVAGAPVEEGEAQLDDGSDTESDLMHLSGKVVDVATGEVIPNATVEVWHCNSKGNYSFFDQSQSDFNMRRTIKTDNGQYTARSIVPSGYSVPPGNPTEQLLTLLGRHGSRPAHIHFFVHAPGYRHLTTQINLSDDPFCHDDFAYATRDELIVDAVEVTDPEKIAAAKMKGPYKELVFDFSLTEAVDSDQEIRSSRARAAL